MKSEEEIRKLVIYYHGEYYIALKRGEALRALILKHVIDVLEWVLEKKINKEELICRN